MDSDRTTRREVGKGRQLPVRHVARERQGDEVVKFTRPFSPGAKPRGTVNFVNFPSRHFLSPAITGTGDQGNSAASDLGLPGAHLSTNSGCPSPAARPLPGRIRI